MPDPALWLGLKARVADPDPESRVPISGEGRTADGRIAAWQTRPLPDGATLVAFSDVTARRGLEQALAAKARGAGGKPGPEARVRRQRSAMSCARR